MTDTTAHSTINYQVPEALTELRGLSLKSVCRLSCSAGICLSGSSPPRPFSCVSLPLSHHLNLSSASNHLGLSSLLLVPPAFVQPRQSLSQLRFFCWVPGCDCQSANQPSQARPFRHSLPNAHALTSIATSLSRQCQDAPPIPARQVNPPVLENKTPREPPPPAAALSCPDSPRSDLDNHRHPRRQSSNEPSLAR